MCVCVYFDWQPVTGSCRQSCMCLCTLTGDLSLGLVGRVVCVYVCTLIGDLSLGLVDRVYMYSDRQPVTGSCIGRVVCVYVL